MGAMKIIDSDLLIAIVNKSQDAEEKMRELMDSEDYLGTTVFNVQEVVYGILDSKDKKNYVRTLDFLKSFNILGYGLESALKGAEIDHYLEKKGSHIGFMDTMIAAVCLSNNASIITRNVKHFSLVPGLIVEGW